MRARASALVAGVVAGAAAALAQSPDDAPIRSGTPWYTVDGQRMYAGA